MSCRYRHIVGLMIGLAMTPALYADADAEREALARIVHELQAIESLITQAQAKPITMRAFGFSMTGCARTWT